MTQSHNVGTTDRRGFLRESASSVGALALGSTVVAGSVLGANERINVGIIGTGSRGGTLLNWIQRLASTHNLRVTAVCDLWPKRREQAAKRVETWSSRAPAVCRNLAELCGRSDVDAVLIATADFQHCSHAASAVAAGKDVYVEKPFGCDFGQVHRAYESIRAADRIVQFGVQSRGQGKYYQAARFVQAGMLGQVTYVEIAEPICQQRWRIEADDAPRPGEIDWAEFLTYLPGNTPVDGRRFREFRLFWPFSSGPFCQWMSHRIDLVNLVLGKTPTAAVSLGGVYLWNDGRTNPDTVQCLLEYPGGTMVSYHMRMGNSYNGRGITLYGTAGTLELDKAIAYGNGGIGAVAERQSDGPVPAFHVDRARLLKDKKSGGVSLDSPDNIDYLGHFFDCVRSRKQPRGDLRAAYAQSVATILANTAFRTGVKATYDPATHRLEPAISLT